MFSPLFKKSRSVTLFCSILWTLGVFQHLTASLCHTDDGWDEECVGSRLYGAYTIGQGVGINKSYGSLGLFWIPKSGSDTSIKPLFDLQGHYIENNRWALNLGGGLRWMLDSSCQMLGANIYYDYRQASHHGNFNQVGLGLEFLSKTFDFRINGYLPICRQHQIGEKFVKTYSDGLVAISHKTETAMKGVDAEAGVCLLRCNAWKLYTALGTYYYYVTHDPKDHIWGGKARIFLCWNDYISLEGRTTYDNIFHSRVQGVASVNIPLDLLFSFFSENCSCFTCFCDLFNETVQRNDLIVLDPCCCWKWGF